jgi:hypothetical protein
MEESQSTLWPLAKEEGNVKESGEKWGEEPVDKFVQKPSENS